MKQNSGDEVTGGTEDTAQTDQAGGSATNDYGGIARELEAADVGSADEVGADPPGGLLHDIGGQTPYEQGAAAGEAVEPADET